MKRLTFILILMNILSGFGQGFEIEEVKLEAKIQTLDGVNQKYDDYSPFVIGDQLYFSSTRPFNKHNIGEDNWPVNAYSNIFHGKIDNDFEGTVNIKDVQLLSNKLNSGSDTGPISFTKNGDTLFFSRVEEINTGGQRIFRKQLFSTYKTKNSWSKIRKLPFSNSSDSYAHPAYDPIKKRLYFVSDKQGGKGKNDIYYSEIINGNWSEPINLESVNTAEEEKFPFIINGNIFFSSDRSLGQGQMDIYFSSPDPKNYPIKLDGLNSAYDDFGIFILPDLSAGYFVSNRNGNNDIFYFSLNKKVTIKSNLTGAFSFRSLESTASNLTVQIINESGDFVYEQKTDSLGHFAFENVKLDSNFSVRVGEDLQDDMNLDFYNELGEITASFILSKNGDFLYKKIFYTNSGILEFIPTDMKDFQLNTAKLSGKLMNESGSRSELKNQTINILDKNQNVIYSTTTDDLGNFEVNNLKLTDLYTIQIPNCDEDIILYVYDGEDKIYTQLKCNSMDVFLYRRLRPDLTYNLALIEDTEESIFMTSSADINGTFNPIDSKTKAISCTVRVYNEEGILIGITRTDSLGNFQFNTFQTQNTYKFTADTQIPLFLDLYDRYGKRIATIQQEENNFFIFRPLGFQSNTNLTFIEDILKFDIRLSSRYEAVLVYFNTNESNVLAADMDNLNTVVKLLKKFPQLKLSISAYADATASEEYNFKLSEKRAEWIASYLKSKGIDANRLTLNAYGETRLIDPENDSINRRAELRIYL